MIGVAVGVERAVEIASKGSGLATRQGWRAMSVAVALALMGTPAALAQNCNVVGMTGPTVAGAAAGAVSSIAGSLGNVSTAFVTQQTSAFVAGSTATQPDQTSSGFWTRAVGSRVDVSSNTTVTASLTDAGGGLISPGSGTCDSKVRQNFFGFQAGHDIARLNWGGWNVHLGATAGYLSAEGEDVAPGSIKTEFQVPFVGGYVVATHGSFFSDVSVRREFYNVSAHQPTFNLHAQPFGARAWSVSAGAGYNFALADGWFAEPSAGLIVSRTNVDRITLAGPIAVPINGTLTIDDINSTIGRATIRVGRNFVADGLALQPFGSASVFHEFAGNVTANYLSCDGCTLSGGNPATIASAFDTSRVGTYGQFSLGVAGQIIDTGWVGFVRGDYRIGENIEGWTANAGLRYNFVPERPAPVGKMAVKAAPAMIAPYIWSGFYVGGHFGAAQGRGQVEFVDTGVAVDPYVSGYFAGGQAGINFQNGPYVIGFEAEISGTNTKGASTCGTDKGFDLVDGVGVNPRFSPLFLTCENELQVIATAALRVGVVSWWSDRTLFFGKAGGAWTREEVTVGCAFGPGNNNPAFAAQCRNPAGALTGGFSGSDTTFGGIIGVGAEFGLTRDWSAKAEIDYVRFRNQDVTASDGSRLNIGAGFAQAKIGVNYRFGQMP